MKVKISISMLVCLVLILAACSTTVGPKLMYKTDTSTGDVVVPVTCIGGLEGLKKKAKGTLYITNTYTKFVSKLGKAYLDMPTDSIVGVYVGDEVKRRFGKTLGRMLLIGVFALFFKDKSEVIAIEFRDEEKNLVVHPIFQIKVGTGVALKSTIELKAGIGEK